MLNEVNMDFRIPGFPHSVVKQDQNSRVRELVKKIENHPHRHALQRDLQQNESYNPFSTTSKKMIKDVGNVELFELFETDPKTQYGCCKEFFHASHVAVPQSVVRSSLPCCPCISATSTPRGSSKLFVPLWFLMKLTLLQVISMEQRDDVGDEIISVILMRHLRTVLCPRHWALHHRRVPGSSPNNRADVCGFLEPPGSQRFWKVN